MYTRKKEKFVPKSKQADKKININEYIVKTLTDIDDGKWNQPKK